ncbi:MAG: hypothetical protein J5I94_03205 [Phaeodactylibacter sp.]|nr:hypothetical protein [Phaeodactylibacter sp.]
MAQIPCLVTAIGLQTSFKKSPYPDNPKNMKHKITGAREAPQMPGFDQGSIREYGAPGGGGYFWILFFIAAAIIVATQIKKENPDLNVSSGQELFDKLPDDAKEAFIERYGQPDDDDRECELFTG